MKKKCVQDQLQLSENLMLFLLLKHPGNPTEIVLSDPGFQKQNQCM